MGKLENIHNQIKKLREDAKVAAKEAFHTGAKEFFDSNPDVELFRWTQYTPYFNDGDPCVFQSSYPWPEVKNFDTVEDEDGEYNDHVPNSLETFLKQFDTEDMENMFGDHVQVTVTRSGVDVDEYSHD